MDISVEVRSVGVAGGIRGEPTAEAGIVKPQAEGDEARFKVEALARILIGFVKRGGGELLASGREDLRFAKGGVAVALHHLSMAIEEANDIV